MMLLLIVPLLQITFASSAVMPSAASFSFYQSSSSVTNERKQKRRLSYDDKTTCLNARPQTRHRYVQSNILDRRTINDFEPTLPPNWEMHLNAAIDAGIHAPNHRRTEPWRFYLLGEQPKTKICKLQQELVTASKGDLAGQAKYDRWMAIPGWLVVTCRGSTIEGGVNDMNNPTSVSREDYAACCCAVQNICLSLHSRGIGTKWTTGPVNFNEDFANVVGFKKDEEYVVGTIWFGTPQRIPSMPVKKLGLSDVLTRVD